MNLYEICRYSGKEKDEESGLYYHGARYYACWLGRWTAADPIGLVDGVNIYAYVNGNPVSGVDPSGTTTEEKVDEGKVFPTFEEVEIKGEGGANENSKSLRDYVDVVRSIENIASSLYEKLNERNSMVSRLLRDFGGYTNIKWNLTSGSVDSDFREQIDRNLAEVVSKFGKGGAFNRIKDPITGIELDMSHMHATLSSYLYNKTGKRIRMELAGWAGDMHTYSKRLAEYDRNLEIEIRDLNQFAAENLGSKSGYNETFSLEDLIADVDARNIAILVKQREMSVTDAIEQYYLSGGVQKRFTSFIKSYGGLNGFASSVNSYKMSTLNWSFNRENRKYREAAQFGLINVVRKMAENE
jgi:RHS repeat-associated protein